MSSTYRELHDDYRQRLLAYTEKAVITERHFMRALTKGISDFQRRTNYVEGTKTLTSADSYALGNDVLTIREIRDSDDVRLIVMSDQQYRTTVDQSKAGAYGYHDMAMHPALRTDATLLPDWGAVARVCTVWDNKLVTYPPVTGETFTLYYIKNLHPFSSNSDQWTDWFPAEGDFMGQFASASISPELSPYEDTFVTFAVARYLEDIGHAMAATMQTKYESMCAEAREMKPQLMTEGSSPYNVSPYS